MAGTFRSGRLGAADFSGDLDLEADVAIIGAGAGGGGAALALAERGLSVLVLEEGSHWQPAQFKKSAVWAWRNLYQGRGTRGSQGNAVMPIPSGRGVGGSTLINSAICFRTPDSVLDRWRTESGAEHFTSAWMGECFDRIWARLGVTVNPPEVQRDNNRIFKAGAEALGLRGDWMARSAPGCVGCGSCQQGCSVGAKQSSDRTFLADAVATGNCAVYGDCRVDSVATAGGKVTELRGKWLNPSTDTPVGEIRVRARHFIVSAGAIGSPRFLLQNELAGGPVGENLFVHPTAGTIARFTEQIRPWTGVTQGYYVDQWEKGFLLQVFSAPPDQMWVSLPLPPEEAVQWMADIGRCAMAGAVVHDEDSVGRVTASGLHYSLGEHDRKVLLEAMRTKARIYFAAGAEAVVPGIHGPGVLTSPSQINAAIPDSIPAHEVGLYAAHPMGTCRMGKDPATSVVSPEGRVWGWDNLSVADASVFPTSLGVNPQVTTYAVGLTVGRLVAELG